MSTKPNTNLNAVELTPSELDSVAGGDLRQLQQASMRLNLEMYRGLNSLSTEKGFR